ncbi:MAG: hypothetical protein LYZ70_07595 [Nitrososphaerales archaeon]|nr:hypothetical protein [Nitrososphaerales archaeon]
MTGMGSAKKRQKKMAKEDGKLAALPIKLCEPHPDLQTRLKYDRVDQLAEDIRANGQLQPGRAVEKPDGTGYLVYIGIGRLFAVKKLFEKYGEPKSYFAILDEGLPFVELFSRSMSENLKRKNLSVLEEVRSYSLASKLASEKEIVQASRRIGESAVAVKRMIALAGVFGDKLSRLYDIEAKTGFSFQLGHLEVLGGVNDDRKLYETAAVTASSRFNAKEVKSSMRANSIGGLVNSLAPWFGELFPEYRDTTTGSKSRRKRKRGSAGSPPAGVPYKENLPFVECPHCGAQNPFELKEKCTLTLYRFDGTAVPKKDSASPDGVYRRSGNCVNTKCGKEFWLVVSSIDSTIQVGTRTTIDGDGGFSVPSGRPKICSISWDDERKTWLVSEKDEAGVEKLYIYGEDKKFVEA